ncbi:nucleotide-diphospho-sugar transferase [Cyathus striatus]|nr:nucleotide-diphospho-sugar transferase [Cyathus striatus]
MTIGPSSFPTTAYRYTETQNCPRALEIGSWEGRSVVYLLTSLCKEEGEMICIDHFDLLTNEAGRARREKVQHNLALTGGKYRIMEQFSIYIDSSHEADDTSLDGELCWHDSIHHPKKGIDALLELHGGHYQVVLRKTTDIRIGFLVASSQPNASKVDDIKEALGYSTNVALTVDSKYAMAAAVVIRSAVERILGRITFYIVDCGLSAGDKEKLKLTLPEGRTDTTLKFLDLPDGALATELGPSWAKLDILYILPVERCLYLDSDVLVRKNRRPYFNAGAILLDLALIHRDISTMPNAARSTRTSTFCDQDVLNCHFTSWKALSLTWNAQGLGTSAVYPSSDRKSFNHDEMLDPAIVRFTGPVHPSLAEILNPYLCGSPGHPFEKAWWDVVDILLAWTPFRRSSGVSGRARKVRERTL